MADEFQDDSYFVKLSSTGSNSPISFQGSVLILPIVSLANVPQLAVDLLIDVGACSRIGSLDPSDHIPVVGARDTCPVEVYQTPDRSVTILQQRSPVLKSRKETHVSRLSSWIEQAGFASVLLLVSVDAATRADAHLQHPSPLFQLTSGSDESSFNLRARLRDQYAPFVDKPTPPVPVLSAGGLARRLITQLRTTNALVIYVAEGDSRPDAKLLAHATLKVMPEGCQAHWPQGLVTGDEWNTKEPASWNVSDTFHRETRAELFG